MYYVVRKSGGFEMRQNRFKYEFILGLTIDNDVMAVSRDIEEMKAMTLNLQGSIHWPKKLEHVPSRGSGVLAEMAAANADLSRVAWWIRSAVTGYLAAAYFTDYPEDVESEEDEPCRRAHVEPWTDDAQWSSEAIREAEKSCLWFVADNSNMLARAIIDPSRTQFMNRVGELLWYARNGHGIGFEDLEYEEGAGDAQASLQYAAKIFGSRSVYCSGGKLMFSLG